jgi:hypothetical protein
VIGYLEAALALLALLHDGDELRLSLGAALSDIHGFASEGVRENYERASELCAAVGSTVQLFGVLYARLYFHAIHADRDEARAIAAELERLARRLRTTEHRVVADSVLVRTALYDGRSTEASRCVQRLRTRRRQPAAAAVAYGVDPLLAATSHGAIAL